MNIIRQETKLRIKSWIIWALSLSVFIVIILTEFSAYKNNPELLEILDAFPIEMLKAFGLTGANLTTVGGFVSVTMVYMQIMASVYAVMLGADLIAAEHKNKTTEFIFVVPRTRKQLLVFKAVAGIVLCVMMSVFIHGAILLGTMHYEPETDYYRFLLFSTIALVILMVVFMFVGFLLAAILPRPKQATLLGPILVFAGYILAVFVDLVDTIDWMKWLTPLSYFRSSDILEKASLSMVNVVVSLLIMMICGGLAIHRYQHKDIPL